jgi:TRAP-type C4-dicarboxylate transport system substrate-binding protein
MDSLKLYPIAPYCHQVSFGAMPVLALTANERALERLPEAVRRIILEVAAKTEARSAPFTKEVYDRTIETIQSNGAMVVPIAEAARAAWADELAGWPAERAREIEEQAVIPMLAIPNSYLAAAEKAGYVRPHRYVVD